MARSARSRLTCARCGNAYHIISHIVIKVGVGQKSPTSADSDAPHVDMWRARKIINRGRIQYVMPSGRDS
jgi:hypothetical protein